MLAKAGIRSKDPIQEVAAIPNKYNDSLDDLEGLVDEPAETPPIPSQSIAADIPAMPPSFHLSQDPRLNSIMNYSVPEPPRPELPRVHYEILLMDKALNVKQLRFDLTYTAWLNTLGISEDNFRGWYKMVGQLAEEEYTVIEDEPSYQDMLDVARESLRMIAFTVKEPSST